MVMMERVARAVADNDPSGVQWDLRGGNGKRQALWIAKAVLSELCKPIGDLAIAGQKVLPTVDDAQGGTIAPNLEQVGACFTAIVQAALLEHVEWP